MLNFLPALLLFMLSGPIQSDSASVVARGEMIRFVVESQELLNQQQESASTMVSCVESAPKRERHQLSRDSNPPRESTLPDAENPRDGPQ
jgi:hypothetical protein